jgi:hypothetical protein
MNEVVMARSPRSSDYRAMVFREPRFVDYLDQYLPPICSTPVSQIVVGRRKWHAKESGKAATYKNNLVNCVQQRRRHPAAP